MKGREIDGKLGEENARVTNVVVAARSGLAVIEHVQRIVVAGKLTGSGSGRMWMVRLRLWV